MDSRREKLRPPALQPTSACQARQRVLEPSGVLAAARWDGANLPALFWSAENRVSVVQGASSEPGNARLQESRGLLRMRLRNLEMVPWVGFSVYSSQQLASSATVAPTLLKTSRFKHFVLPRVLRKDERSQFRGSGPLFPPSVTQGDPTEH